MQVWDMVKVVAAEHEYVNKAGVVIRSEPEKQIATVKLDGVVDPVVFADAELSLLGR